MKKEEEQIHQMVCQWLDMQYPLVLYRSDGGGLRLPIGLAVKFKKIQYCKAWPDLFIAHPSNGFHGMFIEIKKDANEVFKKDGGMRKNKHITDQAFVLNELFDLGYYAVFGLGFYDIIAKIGGYLGVKVI